MGELGNKIHQINFGYFGLFAYIYPLALLYPIYCYHKNTQFSFRRIELVLASIFLFLLLLTLQFMLFDFGVIGKAITLALKPSIGIFGIWVLCLLGIGMCTLSYTQQDILELIKKIDTQRLKNLTKALLMGIYHQIIIPTKNKFQQSIKEFFARKSYKNSDFAYLEEFEAPHTKPNLTDLIDLNPIDKDDNPPKELPNFTPKIQKAQQKVQENISPFKYDEEIRIQEVFVSHRKEDPKQTIRVIDENIPKKENPFLQDDLLRHKTSRISSSAELLKKIRKEEQSPSSQDQQSLSIQETTVPTISNPLQDSSSSTSSLNSHLNPITPPPMLETPTISQASFEDNKENLSPTHSIQEDSFSTSIQKLDLPHHIPSSKQHQALSSTQKTKLPSSCPHIKKLAENEALLQDIDKGTLQAPKDYKLPPIELLAPAPSNNHAEVDESEIDFKIQNLLEKLSVFKIDGDVVRTYSGPIITTLEFRPAANVKVSRIQSLENDLAMALEAKSIRIQAPIPGKSVVGIEIPNSSIQTIYLREIFESELFKNSLSPLTLALGKDVVGNPFVTDLKKLPHLLIAGTTGSGKSVGVNAMILSLLYRNSPDDLKLMMVDPKMVEFMPYNDLPHLITPIITDPKKAVIGLSNAVKEMERRYTLMSQSLTKEIVSYNQKAQQEGLEKFPYFVIIIDELADLMMTAGKEVEYSMIRIAQMGRASGIHLIVATQSPRAEVLTGLIKTNLPAHLSYKVGTKIDAGIIGCAGAETLLGRGDMLFTPPGASGLVRLHAPWSSEEEVNEIVRYIKEQREVMYDPDFTPEEKEVFGAMDNNELDSEMSDLVSKAQEIILQDKKTSGSHLQRRLGIGYNKAANIIEHLEKIGFLSEPNAKGIREIL